MKYFKFLTILFFSLLISLYSCKEKTSSSKKETPKLFVPTVSEVSQNAAGAWHYTCIKGCTRGAGSAINCATCGIILVHNTAYHANANSPQSSAPFATPTVIPNKTEPSQNLAGIWHYTCEKGCKGGSGTAGNCETCGNALAHNAAYHQ